MVQLTSNKIIAETSISTGMWDVKKSTEIKPEMKKIPVTNGNHIPSYVSTVSILENIIPSRLSGTFMQHPPPYPT